MAERLLGMTDDELGAALGATGRRLRIPSIDLSNAVLARISAADLVPLLGLEPPPHPTVALEQALKDGRIVAASHAGVFTLIEAFAAGQVRNGYGAARALGFSPLEARNRPATAALHALNDLRSTNVRRHE